MKERSDGILFPPSGVTVPKLSWEDTARKMAAAAEDWSEWEAIAADGREIQWRDPVPPCMLGKP